MANVGVIVGRFQIPKIELHLGYVDLIAHVKKQSDTTVVVLGVPAVPGTPHNPLDYQTRADMLLSYEDSLVVLPKIDEKSDEVWSKNLDALLMSLFPFDDVVLWGSEDSFIDSYSGELHSEYFKPNIPHSDLSSTHIREQVVSKPIADAEFRCGVIYSAHNRYINPLPTVDIAVYRVVDGKASILLCTKADAPGLYRLPGGFVDYADYSLEVAAKRELHEELPNINTSTDPEYVVSRGVEDWRYSRGKQGLITTVFAVKYESGNTLVGDDIDSAEWVNVEDIGKMGGYHIAPEHDVIMEYALRFIKAKEAEPNVK